MKIQRKLFFVNGTLVATQLGIKMNSHLTYASAFPFSFDLCRPVLENANMMCEHHHLLPETKLVTFHANAGVVREEMGSEPFTLRTSASHEQTE